MWGVKTFDLVNEIQNYTLPRRLAFWAYATLVLLFGGFFTVVYMKFSSACHKFMVVQFP